MDTNNDGIPESWPITLNITGVNVYINPKGITPPDASDIQINGQTMITDIPGLICFDAVPGLSGDEISNETSADLTLTVTNGLLRLEDWKDMYVLLNYEVNT